jgi:hypothetical protein
VPRCRVVTIFRIAWLFRKWGQHCGCYQSTLQFLSNKFLSSGRLDVEAAAFLYRQCICFCQFWCNTKVSKPYASLNLHIRSQSQSYVTTDGQLTCLSWYQAPISGPRPDYFYRQTLRFCCCGSPSLTRGWVCRLQLLLALASEVILGSESPGTHDLILLPQIRDSPNLEGHVPIFISPRNRVVPLNVLLITSQNGPHRKHCSSVAVSNFCHGNALVCEIVT